MKLREIFFASGSGYGRRYGLIEHYALWGYHFNIPRGRVAELGTTEWFVSGSDRVFYSTNENGEKLKLSTWNTTEHTTGMRLTNFSTTEVDPDKIIELATKSIHRYTAKHIKMEGFDNLKTHCNNNIKLPLWMQCWAVCPKQYVVKVVSSAVVYGEWFYTSCCERKASLRYELNKWTRRENNCGAIGAFDSVEHARMFCNWGENCDLLICEYKPTSIKSFYFLEERLDFSIRKTRKNKVEMNHGFPLGTVFVGAVKPVAIVPRRFWQDGSFPFINVSFDSWDINTVFDYLEVKDGIWINGS